MRANTSVAHQSSKNIHKKLRFNSTQLRDGLPTSARSKSMPLEERSVQTITMGFNALERMNCRIL